MLETVAHTIQGRGHGVGGESQSEVARLERLELGGFRLEQPIAALRTSSVGRIAAEGAIGNLGGEILHRFTVTFDYPRKRMILEPNAPSGTTPGRLCCGAWPEASAQTMSSWKTSMRSRRASYTAGEVAQPVCRSVGTPSRVQRFESSASAQESSGM